MIEFPEAFVISAQMNKTISSKIIKKVTANHSPHKFAWFHGEPGNYDNLLKGKRIGKSLSFGGLIEIEIEEMRLLLGDGVNLKYYEKGEKKPLKHQLLVEFEDESFFTGSVQMYGGLWCFEKDTFDNFYYLNSKKLPSPISEDFNLNYFYKMIENPEYQKLSAKAFLATEQRIPGLGNGVLQDILWESKIHPKRKIKTLSSQEKEIIFENVKYVLKKMIDLGGRDIEKDFFGNNGNYITKMSKNGIKKPCKKCGGTIKKEAYLGGSIYFCENCQKL
jgi:formamidopyrimidine-DNA glycosylase